MRCGIVVGKSSKKIYVGTFRASHSCMSAIKREVTDWNIGTLKKYRAEDTVY
jgi:hypothetical protein